MVFDELLLSTIRYGPYKLNRLKMIISFLKIDKKNIQEAQLFYSDTLQCLFLSNLSSKIKTKRKKKPKYTVNKIT